MADHSLAHASFTIERDLAASSERVFQAFANKEAKERWFGGPGVTDPLHTMDFQIGGHESAKGEFHDVTHRFEATYYDIVPNERIVYAYEMYLNDERISVSLATIELKTTGDTTHLILTEDGVFLDDLDTVESRERGTRELMAALEHSLVI